MKEGGGDRLRRADGSSFPGGPAGKPSPRRPGPGDEHLAAKLRHGGRLRLSMLQQACHHSVGVSPFPAEDPRNVGGRGRDSSPDEPAGDARTGLGDR